MNSPAAAVAGRAGAVFISYASQDADAARRICEALRSGGVEVWFDADGGLEHGDEWDAKIRRQIKECVLFIAIISTNTQAREEGYFRLEWDLAAERARTIASGVAFILPVVIDATREADALVPDRFRTVQWTRLENGEVTPEVKARYLKLWSHRTGGLKRESAAAQSAEGAELENTRHGKDALPTARRRAPVLAAIAVLMVALGLGTYFALRPVPGSTRGQPAPNSEVKQLVAKAWVLLNKTELGRPELEAANELCKKAAALDTTDAEVQAAWSQVDSWFVFHNFDGTPERREGARTKAARALQLAPTSYEARLAQTCYAVRGVGPLGLPADTGGTEDLLQTLLREQPDEPRALFTLATLQANLERFPEARVTYHRLAANHTFAATAWSEIGWLETQAFNYRAAEEPADRSLALQPFWGNLLLKSFVAAYWHGDFDRALAALQRLSGVARQEDVPVSFACDLYYNRREPALALSLLETVSRDWLRSNFYEGPKAILAALAHEQLGRKDRAEAQWQAALRLIERRLADHPTADLLLGLKAYALAALGRKAEAESTMRLLPDALTAYGRRERDERTYLRMDQPDRALDLLETDPALTAAMARMTPAFDPLRPLARFQALLARLEADPRRSPNAPAAKPDDKPSATPDKSVAVLAFANVGGDKDNEAFSDGISDELISALGRVPGLRVKARTSSFFFKGSNATAREKGEKLGATYLVDGTVRRLGDSVRITAQLVRAATDENVWISEPLTRKVKEVFAVQEEIAGLIAQALSLKLGASSAAATASVDPRAFEFYAQARQLWSSRRIADLDRAEELLNRVLTLEPHFARAHAALADVWLARANQAGEIGAPNQRRSTEHLRIFAKIQQTLALDPESAEARGSLGTALHYGWENGAAERELRRSIQSSPSYAPAHQSLGRLLVNEGRMDEALAELKLAVELDPLSPVILGNYAGRLVEAHRYADATAMSDRALALLPDLAYAQWHKADALLALRRPDDAVLLARSFDASLNSQYVKLRILAGAGLIVEAEAMLPAFPARSRNSRSSMLLALGRREEALAELDAPSFSVTSVGSVLFTELWDPIRAEPRFVKFIAELGLTEAHARAQAWRAAHPPEKPSPKK